MFRHRTCPVLAGCRRTSITFDAGYSDILVYLVDCGAGSGSLISLSPSCPVPITLALIEQFTRVHAGQRIPRYTPHRLLCLYVVLRLWDTIAASSSSLGNIPSAREIHRTSSALSSSASTPVHGLHPSAFKAGHW